MHIPAPSRWLPRLILSACALTALGVEPTTDTPPSPVAPPTAVSSFNLPAAAKPTGIRPLGLVPYENPDASDDEQLYLELINRARTNPHAEALRLANPTDAQVASTMTFFSVNTALMLTQFSTIGAAPPLAMNARLLAAARAHSGDMFTNNFQAHEGTDGSTPFTRIAAQGYAAAGAAENIYAGSKSTGYGHAAFEVDWGVPPNAVGGMQSPPGHRNNIHSPDFREVGVGIVNGLNGGVGPQVVTQDFGTQQADQPLLTGAAYYDFNTNAFYDPGEGIGGVTVSVSGGSFYAVTPASGGFTMPLPGNGNYTITFSAAGMDDVQKSVAVSSGNNVKVDFTPAYQPPTLSGPAGLAGNTSGNYSISTVAGAISYQYESSQTQPFTTVDGAENGPAGMSVQITGNYNFITNRLGGAGKSYHLAHFPSPTAQSLTLTRTLLPRANGSLSFESRLGFATTNQVATVQVSLNQGTTWTPVFSQAGNGSAENAYSTKTVSLAAYAGQPLMVRFAYRHLGGVYFTTDATGTGWYFDNIGFANVDEITNAQVTSVASGGTFAFKQAASGESLLRARALLPGRTLAFGPLFRVSTQAAVVATAKLVPIHVTGSDNFQVDVNSATPRTRYVLESSVDLDQWSVISTNTPVGTTYTALKLSGAGTATQRYFRLRALP